MSHTSLFRYFALSESISTFNGCLQACEILCKPVSIFFSKWCSCSVLLGEHEQNTRVRPWRVRVLSSLVGGEFRESGLENDQKILILPLFIFSQITSDRDRFLAFLECNFHHSNFSLISLLN